MAQDAPKTARGRYLRTGELPVYVLETNRAHAAPNAAWVGASLLADLPHQHLVDYAKYRKGYLCLEEAALQIRSDIVTLQELAVVHAHFGCRRRCKRTLVGGSGLVMIEAWPTGPVTAAELFADRS